MKQKNGLWATAFLLAGVLTSGCSDDNQYGGSSAEPGSPVLFSVVSGGSDTRTIYESNLQINWVKGDLVGICSPSANVEHVTGAVNVDSATYKVDLVDADGHPHHAKIVPAYKNNYLKWGNNLETPAIFYGAYPADRIEFYPTGEDGLFQMEYITNQVCTVTSFENGNYQTQPDMKNAYMIAKNELKPKGDHVLLSFDPIMTTPDITITAGSYEVGTGIIQPVTVTGVSILMPKALTGKTLDYKINTVTNGPINKDQPRGELLNFMDSGWESVFVQIDNGGKRYVDLYEGESINLMAFLPPFLNLTSAKIRVHTLGGTDFVKTINAALLPQSKIKIQLPDIKPETAKPNNWISKLEGNTLLKEMSIPAYVCKGTETPDDIKKLLRKGVRAFELSGEILDFYVSGILIKEKHYFINEKYCEVFNDFLSSAADKNKDNKEFVMVWAGEDMDLTTGSENSTNFLTKSILSATSSSSVSSLINGVVLMKKVGPDILGDDYYLSNLQDEKVCHYVTITDKLSFYNTDKNSAWKAQFIATEQDENPIIENNKAIYNQIVTYKEQSGCTGIVTIPGADKSFTNNYGDLLLQAVIDCNFKLRRNLKSNQQ